jgi:hypothetical protein
MDAAIRSSGRIMGNPDAAPKMGLLPNRRPTGSMRIFDGIIRELLTMLTKSASCNISGFRQGRSCESTLCLLLASDLPFSYSVSLVKQRASHGSSPFPETQSTFGFVIAAGPSGTFVYDCGSSPMFCSAGAMSNSIEPRNGKK